MTILPLRIDISLSESVQQYDLQVRNNYESIDLASSEVINVTINDVPAYEGNYVVIPETSSQTLETKDKKMLDDILIREIPYYETTNIQNGITVFIADSLHD